MSCTLAAFAHVICGSRGFEFVVAQNHEGSAAAVSVAFESPSTCIELWPHISVIWLFG